MKKIIRNIFILLTLLLLVSYTIGIISSRFIYASEVQAVQDSNWTVYEAIGEKTFYIAETPINLTSGIYYNLDLKLKKGDAAADIDDIVIIDVYGGATFDPPELDFNIMLKDISSTPMSFHKSIYCNFSVENVVLRIIIPENVKIMFSDASIEAPWWFLWWKNCFQDQSESLVKNCFIISIGLLVLLIITLIMSRYYRVNIVFFIAFIVTLLIGVSGLGTMNYLCESICQNGTQIQSSASDAFITRKEYSQINLIAQSKHNKKMNVKESLEGFVFQSPDSVKESLLAYSIDIDEHQKYFISFEAKCEAKSSKPIIMDFFGVYSNQNIYDSNEQEIIVPASKLEEDWNTFSKTINIDELPEKLYIRVFTYSTVPIHVRKIQCYKAK